MTAINARGGATLRSDLTWHPAAPRDGGVLVEDDVSGVFTRLSRSAATAIKLRNPAAMAIAASLRLCRNRDPAGGPAATDRRGFSPARLMAIRWEICRGDSAARWLAARGDMIWSSTAVVFWMILGSLVAVLLLMVAPEVGHAAAGAALDDNGAVAVMGVVLMTKLIHEYSHAAVCRRVGGSVRSMGIMLFCGMPCPYCDVSDAWRQPDRFRRAAVMAAGVYAEWVAATIAGCVFLSVDDPAVRGLAATVVIVCFLGGIVFNANPLMRYDGYYVLADWLGSVSLASDAAAAWRGIAGRSQPVTRRRLAMAAYHLARQGYRVIVLLSITAMMMFVAGHFGLTRVGFAIAAVSIFAVAWRGLVSTRRSAAAAGTSFSRFRWARIVGVLTLLGLSFVPLPRWTTTHGILTASKVQYLDAKVAATVQGAALPWGIRVRQGQTVGAPANDDLAIRRCSLADEIAIAQTQALASQRAMVDGDDDIAAEQYRSAMLRSESLQQQLTAVEHRTESARWIAHRDGLLIGPPGANGVGDTLLDANHWLRPISHQTVVPGDTVGRIVGGELLMEIDWPLSGSVTVEVGDTVLVWMPRWLDHQPAVQRFRVDRVSPVTEQPSGAITRLRCVSDPGRPVQRLIDATLVDDVVVAKIIHPRRSTAGAGLQWLRDNVWAEAWR